MHYLKFLQFISLSLTCLTEIITPFNNIIYDILEPGEFKDYDLIFDSESTLSTIQFYSFQGPIKFSKILSLNYQQVLTPIEGTYFYSDTLYNSTSKTIVRYRVYGTQEKAIYPQYKLQVNFYAYQKVPKYLSYQNQTISWKCENGYLIVKIPSTLNENGNLAFDTFYQIGYGNKQYEQQMKLQTYFYGRQLDDNWNHQELIMSYLNYFTKIYIPISLGDNVNYFAITINNSYPLGGYEFQPEYPISYTWLWLIILLLIIIIIFIIQFYRNRRIKRQQELLKNN